MAKSTPWAERSGTQRRRTFGGFGLLYAAIAIVTLAVGWIPIGIIFAVGALGLGIAWFTTTATPTTPEPEQPKPDWLLAMDDPDAPDLSLPEYRTSPRRPSGVDERSAFDRPIDPEVRDDLRSPRGDSPSEAG